MRRTTTGYTALARLRAIQGDRPAMLEAVKTLEETWPEGAFYAQALRHRLLMRHWPDDPDVQKDAQTWLAQSGIDFGKLDVIHSVDPMSMAQLRELSGRGPRAGAPGKREAGAYPLEDVHAYLERQQDFAAAHEFTGPVVEIAIARTLLYQAAGKKHEALEILETALSDGGTHGALAHLCGRMRTPASFSGGAQTPIGRRNPDRVCQPPVGSDQLRTGETRNRRQHEALLSERELEVLRNLAKGLTYEEIGRQLFLSLNTVQFHVKNIYRKLLVNKRVQAIEKAREMNLI